MSEESIEIKLQQTTKMIDRQRLLKRLWKIRQRREAEKSKTAQCSTRAAA